MGCIVVVHSLLLMYDRMCSPTTCPRGTRQRANRREPVACGYSWGVWRARRL